MKHFNGFNKIVLVVEYDGSDYHGFQWQANLRTVQAELEQALGRVTGENSRIVAASRTDTGVHARGQVVSFRTESALPPQGFVRALNHYLPSDIAIKGACRAGTDFDVRRDALSREYDYYILNGTTRSPLARGFAYLVAGELNIRTMNKVCRFLEGEHDFASFVTSLGKLRSTVRTVHKAKVTRQNDLVTFHMVANSFLPHQVRNTLGLLIRVGLGKVAPKEFHRIMRARTLGLAGPTAPSHGLCLTKVNYPRSLELAA
ncbi:MAG: tRNA pseudouridine(38-40) synthase TruA [Dehalococcoidia bacterium]|nr:tRNA pseudouridine(38-40) synthase TruA [Dehalococcoidia bacterium]